MWPGTSRNRRPRAGRLPVRRFGSDFILEGWQRIDLTSLGMVSSLSFSMDSSDKGDFGINTPTYFALDDLTVTAVPEPGTAVLLTLGVVILAAGVSRRR
ncbi:MAG: DUF4465 domain-containing protein [Betaproteobacteria bacterium]|nr:DUF4465 domain-containing protein [Betaproteobacteria bacterium]